MTTTDLRDATDAQFADELARLDRLDVADESAEERVARAMWTEASGLPWPYAAYKAEDELYRDLARAAIDALKPAPGTDTSGRAVQRVRQLIATAPVMRFDNGYPTKAIPVSVLLDALAVAGPQRGHDEEGES